MEVGKRILPVPLTGDDDGVDDGGTLAGVGVADEEPVFLAEGGGTDGVFDEVIVEPALAMAQMRGERLPVWVLAKRLEKGRFSWPTPSEVREKLSLAPEALAVLVGGVELKRGSLKAWYER